MKIINNLGPFVPKVKNGLFCLFLFGIFFAPNVKVSSALPYVRVEDVFVFLATLVLLFNIRRPLKSIKSLNDYLKYIILFFLWMAVCMFGNGRLFYVSDYFEFYKLYKYTVILIYFYLFTSEFGDAMADKAMITISLLMLVFNILNYFNLGNFNRLVMPYYASSGHLISFGKDSLGNPTAKRLLGVMGNPNNNAILWSFFSAYFLAYKKNIWFYLLALIAMFMILLSGSRTVFIGWLFMIGTYWVLNKKSIKGSTLLLLFAAFAFAAVIFLDIRYIASLWTRDLSENTSWLFRLEIWDHLLQMIKRSPVIGYGPDKDYFYQNGLYAENEYLLMAWRYGILGCLMYVGFIALPLFQALRHKYFGSSKLLILFAVIIMFSALTNNPLSEPRFLALLALTCGLFYKQMKSQSIESLDR